MTPPLLCLSCQRTPILIFRCVEDPADPPKSRRSGAQPGRPGIFNSLARALAGSHNRSVAEALPPENPETPFPIVGFQLVGDMTLHGVTDEITWDVLVTYNDEGVVEGKAQTSFPFSKFNLATPELPFLLTVEDEIRLEVDFKVSRSSM